MAYAVKPGDYPKLALYVDGNWGPGTIGAFQTYAKKNGWYPSSYLIDGKEGHHTRVAMQKWLRYYGFYSRSLDGDLGPIWCEGLCRFRIAKMGWYDPDFSTVFPEFEHVQSIQGWLNRVR